MMPVKLEPTTPQSRVKHTVLPKYEQEMLQIRTACRPTHGTKEEETQKTWWLKLVYDTNLFWPRGYKTSFMLSSTEHEISTDKN